MPMRSYFFRGLEVLAFIASIAVLIAVGKALTRRARVPYKHFAFLAVTGALFGAALGCEVCYLVTFGLLLDWSDLDARTRTTVFIGDILAGVLLGCPLGAWVATALANTWDAE